MRYRIKQVPPNSGMPIRCPYEGADKKPRYYPQYRWFFIWRYFHEPFNRYRSFEMLEGAKLFIRREVAKIKNSKVKYFKYPEEF